MTARTPVQTHSVLLPVQAVHGCKMFNRHLGFEHLCKRSKPYLAGGSPSVLFQFPFGCTCWVFHIFPLLERTVRAGRASSSLCSARVFPVRRLTLRRTSGPVCSAPSGACAHRLTTLFCLGDNTLHSVTKAYPTHSRTPFVYGKQRSDWRIVNAKRPLLSRKDTQDV